MASKICSGLFAQAGYDITPPPQKVANPAINRSLMRWVLTRIEGLSKSLAVFLMNMFYPP